MKRWAVMGFFGLSLAAPTTGAELVNLDDFIAGIEKGGDIGCRAKGPLDEFLRQLIDRYSFDGRPRLRTTVKVPERFAAAVGKARAEKQEDYTVIHVPLVGTYRGLRTREIIFYAGHGNGINARHILFDSPKWKVEMVLGPDLARARQAFAADEVIRDFGFRAEVVSRGKGAELICDTST